MSNSPLVDFTLISPNKTCPRKNKIDTITIHHVAGELSVEAMGNVFKPKSAKASANYGIGTDCRVGMYVEEKDRAWTSSSAANDNRAVTIEVANCETGGQWRVSDEVLEKLIVLCVDICKRNGIEKLNFTGDKTGNLTMHKWFSATLCPGPYLESKFPYIAEEVNKRLSGATSPQVTTTTLPYMIRITCDALNVRGGPGIHYPRNTVIRDKKKYTIVEEQKGWGKLKSGAGWISLQYTEKV